MDPYLGEIRLFSFSRVPRGWFACDGRLLPIAQYTALFSLLGTTYGGDGRTNFQLPDLRGRVPVHRSAQGYAQGEQGGEETVTLTVGQIAPHYHLLRVVTTAGDSGNATTNFPAGTAPPPAAPTAVSPELYGPASAITPISPSTVGLSGSSQAHENRQQSMAMSYCIAYEGIYPPRT
jgi:microcystin-dependent protein